MKLCDLIFCEMWSILHLTILDFNEFCSFSLSEQMVMELPFLSPFCHHLLLYYYPPSLFWPAIVVDFYFILPFQSCFLFVIFHTFWNLTLPLRLKKIVSTYAEGKLSTWAASLSSDAANLLMLLAFCNVSGSIDIGFRPQKDFPSKSDVSGFDFLSDIRWWISCYLSCICELVDRYFNLHSHGRVPRSRYGSYMIV